MKHANSLTPHQRTDLLELEGYMSKLIWKRVSEDSKDLRVVNPEELDKAEFLRRLKKLSSTAPKFGEGLKENFWS